MTYRERQVLKQKFIEEFRKSLGNITMACNAIGIDRGTYYNWREKDQNFRQETENVGESAIDFVESALMKKIQNGDTTAIIFYLKTKGKNRGFVERTENYNHNAFEELMKDASQEE